MSSLAIRGGTPVRTDPYPEWPEFGDRDAEAVADVVRHGQVAASRSQAPGRPSSPSDSPPTRAPGTAW